MVDEVLADAIQDAGRLDELPAGGDSVAGVLLVIAVVFIVLIIMDYAGMIDIFPWVNKPPHRRAAVPSQSEDELATPHATGE